MKIVFFGSDIFAVYSLAKLVDSNEEICAVVTQIDKLRGRHLHLGFSAVKEFALKQNLEIIQPENLKDKNFLKQLKDMHPDLFIVAAYGKIVPKEILSIPKIFPLNIHGSILPKYRGAAPINWALINGETTTGVTIIRMNEFMDAGEIIAQNSLEIKDEDTAISLKERLSLLAGDLIIKVVNSIKAKDFSLTPQDKTEITLAPKLKKSDGLINWNDEAIKIRNRVRGLLPWPGSFTYYKGKILKIHQTEILPLNDPGFAPGQVTQILSEAIVVATLKGSIKIKILQLEGANKLTPREFVLGHKINIGDKLG